jgi:hypothetical protein
MKLRHALLGFPNAGEFASFQTLLAQRVLEPVGHFHYLDWDLSYSSHTSQHQTYLSKSLQRVANRRKCGRRTIDLDFFWC